jgi:predicted component of viral defense system (DUF524 family)
VGDLQRIPIENQVLQKRDGYRQILQAWVAVEAAAELNWQGPSNAYNGTNRDTAKLYEYWAYFSVFAALKNICVSRDAPRGEHDEEGIKPFLSRHASGLTINLQEGRSSRATFLSKDRKTAVDLYYNREFPKPTESYSVTLRPDITLAVYPSAYLENASPAKAEAVAADSGELTFVHLDAKYRLESVASVFGDASKQVTGQERDYKVADLYKMHTYNDAIRHTLGSFVIYPGTDTKAHFFMKNGIGGTAVGALPLRPPVRSDDTPSGAALLQNLLTRILPAAPGDAARP